jgi:hypothetical protein
LYRAPAVLVAGREDLDFAAKNGVHFAPFLMRHDDELERQVDARREPVDELYRRRRR